jgi:hypothetical protein
MQLEESPKNVGPMAVLQQRETLKSEGLNDVRAFLAMVLVDERFFA